MFRAAARHDRKPYKRSRLGLLLFLGVVYAGVKLFGSSAPHKIHHRMPAGPQPLPILTIAGIATPVTGLDIYHFSGRRVTGNGSSINLGDRRTQLPGALISRLFPDPLIIPSCLTQLPPPLPAALLPTKPLPIRDDWPGFFGAPWIAHANGDLIALLNVFAPRSARLQVVAAPQFQIYAAYDGKQSRPSFSAPAAAIFTRGSKAVLYRVFPNGPVRCLDLVVQNGKNNGPGHLYYQKNHHYYESDMIFQIQP